MNLKTAIIVFVGLLTIKALALGYNDLNENQQREIDATVKQKLHDKYELPDIVPADLVKHQDEYLKMRDELAIQYLIDMGRISPPPATAPGLEPAPPPSSERPVFANPSMVSSPDKPEGNIIPDPNNPDLIFNGSGTMPADGGAWSHNFTCNWDTSAIKKMNVEITFEYDNDPSIDSADQNSLDFTFNSPKDGCGGFMYLFRHKSGHTEVCKPGLCSVEVRSLTTGIKRNRRPLKFQFTIIFEESTVANTAKRYIPTQVESDSAASDLLRAGAIVNSALSARPSAANQPNSTSSSSGNHTFSPSPYSIRDANGNLHTGVVNLPTSP